MDNQDDDKITTWSRQSADYFDIRRNDADDLLSFLLALFHKKVLSLESAKRLRMHFSHTHNTHTRHPHCTNTNPPNILATHDDQGGKNCFYLLLYIGCFTELHHIRQPCIRAVEHGKEVFLFLFERENLGIQRRVRRRLNFVFYFILPLCFIPFKLGSDKLMAVDAFMSDNILMLKTLPFLTLVVIFLGSFDAGSDGQARMTISL